MPPVQSFMTSTSRFKVFTGQIPFPDFTDANIIVLVSGGGRPKKPLDSEKLGLEPAVWELAEDCWNQDRAKRPDITEVFWRYKLIVTTDPLITPASPDQSSDGVSVSPTRGFMGRASRNGTIQDRINRLDQVRLSDGSVAILTYRCF